MWDHVMLLQMQIQCITALYHRVYRCFYGSHITGKDHDTFSADALAKACLLYTSIRRQKGNSLQSFLQNIPFLSFFFAVNDTDRLPV